MVSSSLRAEMSRIVALLAAVLVAMALVSCGGSEEGAEPDAPVEGVAALPELSLILDFQPNAVHSGIYSALATGADVERGVKLEVRTPGNSSDAPKLLRAGRVDLAILDIHDLAIARERGFDLVGIGAIVQRPLAAVIAADADSVRRPADLAGKTIGVTGLPSDDAVLASVLSGGGLELSDIDSPTIGFEAVPLLSSSQLDAATAFWNAEGVQLRQLGLETREFRVEDFGAPGYPELVIATSRETLESRRAALTDVLRALRDGYELTERDPDMALGHLLGSVPELELPVQEAQLESLDGAFTPAITLDADVLEDWATWDLENGIVGERPEIDAAFDTTLLDER